MALGGGTYTEQNKVFPGTYINFISAQKISTNLSERGIAAIGVELDWGEYGKVLEITSEDFYKNSLELFGCDYSDASMKGLRDLFLNANKVLLYRLNDGVKASATIPAGENQTGVTVTAKYSGTKGNSIKVVVQANVDDNTKFDVSTYMGTVLVDKQTVANAAGLANNKYVTFTTTGAILATTAGVTLSGGTNGTVTGESYQNFLNALESYQFNALACVSTETTIKNLYIAYTRRLREELGLKFQTVIYNGTVDYEGVVNVKNQATESTSALVYWVTGVIASCAINKSNTNRVYNGEYTVEANYTQAQLETAINSGYFTFHKVGNEIRVLKDINSLVTVTDNKGELFKNNQTIRVLDQVATDVAVLFNTKYLGQIQNNDSGRVSLWSDVINLYKEYVTMQAIENFESDDITIEKGQDNTSVVVNGAIQVINSMEKLYMSIVVA